MNFSFQRILTLSLFTSLCMSLYMYVATYHIFNSTDVASLSVLSYTSQTGYPWMNICSTALDRSSYLFYFSAFC